MFGHCQTLHNALFLDTRSPPSDGGIHTAYDHNKIEHQRFSGLSRTASTKQDQFTNERNPQCSPVPRERHKCSSRHPHRTHLDRQNQKQNLGGCLPHSKQRKFQNQSPTYKIHFSLLHSLIHLHLTHLLCMSVTVSYHHVLPFLSHVFLRFWLFGHSVFYGIAPPTFAPLNGTVLSVQRPRRFLFHVMADPLRHVLPFGRHLRIIIHSHRKIAG